MVVSVVLLPSSATDMGPVVAREEHFDEEVDAAVGRRARAAAADFGEKVAEPHHSLRNAPEGGALTEG